MSQDKTERNNHITAVKLPRDRKMLQTMAHAVNGNLKVMEGGFFMPAALVAVAGLLVATGIQDFMAGRSITTVVFGLFAFLLLVFFVHVMKRRQIPLLILTPEGIETTVFQQTLPWESVEDFHINAAKNNVMNVAIGMEFLLSERHLPAENKTSRSGCYYDAKSKKLMISAFNFCSELNRDRLLETIQTYRNAALAKRRLDAK